MTDKFTVVNRVSSICCYPGDLSLSWHNVNVSTAYGFKVSSLACSSLCSLHVISNLFQL